MVTPSLAPSRHARRITLERIEAAAQAIDPVFLHTPQWVCEPLGEELGARVVLKAEILNPIRSFKGRGADWLVHSLPSGISLMCASAGNFGQAMAYACRARGVPLTVYAAEQANPLKIARMRAMGARVVLAGEDFDAAKALALRHVAIDAQEESPLGGVFQFLRHELQLCAGVVDLREDESLMDLVATHPIKGMGDHHIGAVLPKKDAKVRHAGAVEHVVGGIDIREHPNHLVPLLGGAGAAFVLLRLQ